MNPGIYACQAPDVFVLQLWIVTPSINQFPFIGSISRLTKLQSRFTI